MAKHKEIYLSFCTLEEWWVRSTFIVRCALLLLILILINVHIWRLRILPHFVCSTCVQGYESSFWWNCGCETKNLSSCGTMTSWKCITYFCGNATYLFVFEENITCSIVHAVRWTIQLIENRQCRHYSRSGKNVSFWLKVKQHIYICLAYTNILISLKLKDVSTM